MWIHAAGEVTQKQKFGFPFITLLRREQAGPVWMRPLSLDTNLDLSKIALLLLENSGYDWLL